MFFVVCTVVFVIFLLKNVNMSFGLVSCLR